MAERKSADKSPSPRLSAVRTNPSRVIIEGVAPEVDDGRFPIKRTVGETVVVEADVFIDGHEALSCAVLFRRKGSSRWNELLMEPLVNDRWHAEFMVPELGRYEYTVVGWHDRFKGWRRDLLKRIEAEQDITVDLRIGAELVAAAAERARGADKKTLTIAAQKLAEADDEARLVALDERLPAAMTRYADREHQTEYDRVLEVIVDPERARFSTWYELFPRSSALPGPRLTPGGRQSVELSGGSVNHEVRHGTFRDVERWLPHVAALGFDVLYFPPIHPIGETFRKGPNNALVAESSDPGSPWAIGSAQGGHTAIHRELGTLADFKRLIQRAREFDIDLALDIAFQVSPDHPYVTEHPEWFKHRPDGTIQYAENPPKKYQDIYPFDFDSSDARDMWRELRAVFEYWIQQGVRIFRVDNPHTKPFVFWEWCIGSLKAAYPDTIFLSEAFTRPKIMYRLAKLGFTQSYTYFAWRNEKWDLTEYFTELTQTPVREFFRPNLWPNTPDILHEKLQKGGRVAFQQRILLAATLGASYGIYGPAFEHMESEPREAGSEEYLHSEKYQIRQWNPSDPESLAPFIGRLNRIRRENQALQSDHTLRFHQIENQQIIAYSKVKRGNGPGNGNGEDISPIAVPDNIILTVLNLDENHTQAGWVRLPLHEWGLKPGTEFTVRDLLTDVTYTWNAEWNYVELNPAKLPGHILRIERTT